MWVSRERGDTINGIKVTCKLEFTANSLDSSAVISSEKSLWYHFFFLISFFSSPCFYTLFPLLALPFVVVFNSKYLIQRKRRPASLIKVLVLKWTSQKKVSFKTCELPSCAPFLKNLNSLNKYTSSFHFAFFAHGGGHTLSVGNSPTNPPPHSLEILPGYFSIFLNI